jgi:ribosomal protein S27AE
MNSVELIGERQKQMQEQNTSIKQDQAKCRRCGTGTLLLRDELDGPELRCIQCGATQFPVNGVAVSQALAS